MKRCLLSGAVLFFSFSFLHAEEVRVACYNLENYLSMDRWVDGQLVPASPKPEQEIAALVDVIKSVSPHILGVIEMGDREKLEEFRLRLKRVGLDYPHAEWVAGADPDRHVCLLSQFPITSRDSLDNVPFELDGRIQRLHRGILDVTVEIHPDYELRLVGVHLKSRREVPGIDQAQFRAKEAWQLRRHLVGILEQSPDSNLLLFGDLNDTKNEYPIRELIGTRGTPHHMMDLWLADSRGERWTHYWKAADTYSRIDYFLVSPGLLPEIQTKASGICDPPNWNVGSDHRLIHTSLTPRNQ